MSTRPIKAALNLLDKLHSEYDFALSEYVTIHNAIQNDPSFWLLYKGLKGDQTRKLTVAIATMIADLRGTTFEFENDEHADPWDPEWGERGEDVYPYDLLAKTPSGKIINEGILGGIWLDYYSERDEPYKQEVIENMMINVMGSKGR